ASAQRIAQVLNTPIEVTLGERDKISTGAHIQMENVTFSYSGATNQIENISFSLNRGQTLGIIGPTGSGKTTIINLLMRFYDVSSGSIRINGERIGGLPPQELRRYFGAAFQNDVFLNDTVYENISFLRGLENDQVERAAKAAQIHDFILTMPDGYQSQLDIRGANLSGGQKQRILIARALAGAPEILVLDDSQSALDYKTDAQLRKTIHEEYSQTTTIIVSQRVSAIKNADVILLLQGGRVEGMGTHEELMQTCESYKKIAKVQMGGVPA
ncbi:ABC transporter ATP-binding protein/permease, partial [Eubacteriales bacterium OttesenSCG-928-K08]|nr:ABC transporter ATP-binding protein/permease [Eubacteriales bacterium OttesenSCG-928-K08]